MGACCSSDSESSQDFRKRKVNIISIGSSAFQFFLGTRPVYSFIDCENGEIAVGTREKLVSKKETTTCDSPEDVRSYLVRVGETMPISYLYFISFIRN